MNQKIAVVTGGSGGIGAACCRVLSEVGYKVGIHYNANKNAAEALSAMLPDAFTITGDISTPEGCDAIYNILKSMDIPLEILVNNSGVVKDNPIFSATLEDFDAVVNLNMKGTWYLTKRLVRLMFRRHSGRIINISSVVGSLPNATQSLYGMTKAAIDNFTKVASIEFAPYGILVNAIAPGFIETEMTAKIPDEFKEKILEKIPLGRMGKPEEIAEVVKFLATCGNYITGSVIHVNGGLYHG